MRLLVGIAVAGICFGGQGIDVSAARAANALVTKQVHGPIRVEFELSDWDDAPTVGKTVISDQSTGFLAVWGQATPPILTISSQWNTGGSVCSVDMSGFENKYAKIRWQHDQTGAIGTVKTEHCQAWDRTGTGSTALINDTTQAWVGDSGYDFAGTYIGDAAGGANVRVHYYRTSTTLVPTTTRVPATADAGTWIINLKFDGTLTDSSGNGWTLAMSSGSAVYQATLYQDVFASIASGGDTTWKSGVTQSVTGADSFSDGDASSLIAGYLWSLLSGPNTPMFSSTAVVAPNLTSIVAGDYHFQLIATDFSATTGTTDQHIGVVQVNSSDVVINSFASPYSLIFTGNRLRYGSANSTVPAFDTTHLANFLYRQAQFSTTTGGASAGDSTVAYFDHPEAGTCTATQFSYIVTCSGSSLLTTACSTGSLKELAGAWTSVAAGDHNSDTYTITGANEKIDFAIDGGSTIHVTLTNGSRTPAQIVADINMALGGATTTHGCQNDAVITGAGVAAVDGGGGFLIEICTKTPGTTGSLEIKAVANNAYTTLGLTVGTFTVANVTQYSMQMIPWYDNGSGQVAPYDKGRRAVNVLQCFSDTSAIVQQLNGFGWRLPAATSVSYSLDSIAWRTYLNDNNNQNYYQLDLADYSLAIGTGLDSHKAQARARSQSWVRSPFFDLGQELTTSGDMTSFVGSGQGHSSRKDDLSGPMFWALETGTTWLWANLFERECTADAAKWNQTPGGPLQDQYVDQREAGFSLQRIALCGLYSPNSSYRTTALNNLHSILTVVTASRDATLTYPQWPVMYQTQASYNTSTSVCLTNGSTSVVANGSTFTQTYGSISGGQSFNSYIWFFPTPGTRPASNSVGDAVAYTFTKGDTTHITLGSTYAGATACTGVSGTNKGFALFNSTADVPYVGYTAQPFMLDILGLGFADAYQAALTDAVHPLDAALWKGYVSDVAAWMINRGEDYATTPRPFGLFQGADSVNCQYPITLPSFQNPCFAGDPTEGARILTQDATGLVSLDWQNTGTAADKTWLDAIYAGLWAAPATSMPGYSCPLGDFCSGVPKYYGDLAGVDGQPAWTGVRLQSGSVPTLSSISPATARLGTVASVTLTGTFFVDGDSTIGVTGSGITVSNVVVVSATSITATFTISNPVTGLGVHNVTVTTSAGTTGSQTFTVDGALTSTSRLGVSTRQDLKMRLPSGGVERILFDSQTGLFDSTGGTFDER